MSYRLDLPATIIYGGDSREQLPALAKQLSGSRVLLVTDPGVVALGFADDLVRLMTAAGLSVAIFDEIQPDPTDLNVAAGVEALKKHHADFVVALGGGSPIDAAKVIAISQANAGPLSKYMGLHKIVNPCIPLIAMPPTAGTGSEATKVAVITDTESNVKMMMLSAPLLPSAAIVDYTYSMGMPKPLTAAVGVDTLTHGIEAYVSRKANAMTDPLALSCIRLVGQHLETAWNDPDNRLAREGMMLAATQGGMAFANSSVCLVHGMSRPIGAVFHLPHGLSNAILLPTVTDYSTSASPDRYAPIARALNAASDEDSDETACTKLVAWLERLNRSLDLPKLSGCKGVTSQVFEAQIGMMAIDALASGSPDNNPRVPEADEIIELYRKSW